MKRTRGLWASIGFVLALTVASLIGFATGALHAHPGPRPRGRGLGHAVGACGHADRGDGASTHEHLEPGRRVRGGGAGHRGLGFHDRGADPRPRAGHDRPAGRRRGFCLVGPDDENYGCAETEDDADDALGGADGVAAGDRGLPRRRRRHAGGVLSHRSARAGGQGRRSRWPPGAGLGGFRHAVGLAGARRRDRRLLPGRAYRRAVRLLPDTEGGHGRAGVTCASR